MKPDRPLYETEIVHQASGVAHDLAAKQVSIAANSNIQQALFEHISDGVPLSVAARSNGNPVTNVRRAYGSWLQSPPDSQPTSPPDIQFSMRSPGRPRHFTVRQENLITEAALQFSSTNTPLTKVGLRHLARMIVRSRLHETRASCRHMARQRAVRAVNTGQWVDYAWATATEIWYDFSPNYALLGKWAWNGVLFLSIFLSLPSNKQPLQWHVSIKASLAISLVLCLKAIDGFIDILSIKIHFAGRS